MFTHSERMRVMLRVAFDFTKISKSQNTPRLFKNPALTPRGIVRKMPKTYNYDLPEDIPNRHLYWDRTVQNKKARIRYQTEKLRKLKINSIYN